MGFGITELALIAFIILIIFGAGKLPKVMGDLGKGIKSFKEGLKEPEKTTQKETVAIEDKSKISS